MEFIQDTLAQKARKQFLHPGDGPLSLPQVDGVRVYILGPPEDESLLKICDRAGTTYRLGLDWDLASAAFLAFGAAAPARGLSNEEDLREARRMSSPFDECHQIQRSAAAHGEFFKDHYFGSDLRLMSPESDVSGIPTEGKNLVVVAAVGEVLHFRIFDSDGKKAVDTDEKRLTGQARQIEYLKRQLQGLWPPHKMTRSEEDRVIPAVTSIVGYTDCFEAAPWRKIDDDWASVAGPFALQLDNKTNNTSLALAIEIGPPGAGKVLLFPADAQVGNWLSWFGPVSVRVPDPKDSKPSVQDIGKVLSWPGANGAPAVTAADLLRRTVLYKVGHHGSHNATLRESGLKLMPTARQVGDFVAMIPVNEIIARTKAGYGDMPLPDLVHDLLRHTQGGLIRIDEDDTPSDDNPSLRPDPDVPAPVPAFGTKVKTDLYIEYTVS